MQRERITLRELCEQLQAEARRVSPCGLDEQRRERLEAIRQRIDEIRVALGLADS